MKICFLSNFYNPHVSPFCEELAKMPGIIFFFISSGDSNSVNLSAIIKGKSSFPATPNFVIDSSESQQNWYKSKNIVQESDVIIFGSGDHTLIPDNLGNRLFFLYTERLFKKNNFLILRRIKQFVKMKKISEKSAACLCASAYTKFDFSSINLFRNKCLKWGYFPSGNSSLDLGEKRIWGDEPLQVYWSGRMLDWKRPELAIFAIQRMREMKISSHLYFSGDGPKKQELMELVSRQQLGAYITFLGFLTNEENLKKMAASDVVLFTSTRQEGWGATVNEAMSSKTVVIASSQSGSVPFLIKNGINGFSFSNKGELVQRLAAIKQRELDNQIAEAATKTILEHWNGLVAAHNFLKQVNSLFSKGTFDLSISEEEPGSLLK